MLVWCALVLAGGCKREDASEQAAAGPPLATELLGSATAPSGAIRILDCGMIAWLNDGSIPAVPAVEVAGIPGGRSLPVRGRRILSGEFEGMWDSVSLECSSASAVATSQRVGSVPVEWARLMIVDRVAVQAWNHDEPLDGKADFVFWGRDAEQLASVTGAPSLGDGNFGWVDREYGECVELGTRAEEISERKGWKLATDLRPHSHHYHVLKQARGSPTRSATVEIGGATLCFLLTGWGDGEFPVFRDLDAKGDLVRVRIQLATDSSRAAFRSVNPR